MSIANKKARLLIVDDETLIRDLLRDSLSRSYDCEALSSAEEALALVATNHFDVILTDIMMARMTGLEMLPQILKLAPHAAVVMISGQRNIEYAIDAMRAGAFDYVTKPFDLCEVEAVVRRALEQASVRNNKIDADSIDRDAARLSQAIENQEFVVHYQPQVDIRSGALVGVEALVRWENPEFGLLPPADFIPLAEETGLIVPLGNWVMRTACAQAKGWHHADRGRFRMAVNVSPRQLQEGDLIETLRQVLDETGLDAANLEIELTETCIMEDPDSAIEILAGIKEMGASIAIDDFGIGYSSLSYLKHLPIDSIKLDQCFVQGSTTDPDDAALVMGIVTLAHNLRLKVLAEGIETEAQLNFLRLLRCDEGQGYFFGKPAPSPLATRQFACA